jgi:hypothetical protein
MLPERQLHLLQELRKWSSVHLRLERMLARPDFRPTVQSLGDLAWLRVFDCEDLKEFAAELNEALVAADSDNSTAPLDECLKAWRTTAQRLEDPLRRSVLLDKTSVPDLVEADRPE